MSTHGFLHTLFESYDTQLHHQTPNSIVNISKFIWVCHTFGVDPDIDCFGSFYELHNQGPKMVSCGDGEVRDAQFG